MKALFNKTFKGLLVLAFFGLTQAISAQSLVWNYTAGDNKGSKVKITAGESTNDYGERIPTIKILPSGTNAQWYTASRQDYNYYTDYYGSPTAKLKHIRVKSPNSGRIYELDFSEDNKKLTFTMPDGKITTYWLQ